MCRIYGLVDAHVLVHKEKPLHYVYKRYHENWKMPALIRACNITKTISLKGDTKVVMKVFLFTS